QSAIRGAERGHQVSKGSYRLSRRKFLVASSAAVAAACAPTSGGATPSVGAATSTPPTPQTIKIGQILPFSGVYTDLGNSMKRAADLYIKLNPTIANRPVKLLYANDGFGQESARDFTEGFRKQGGAIKGDDVKPPLGNSDFVSFVQQIKNNPTKATYHFYSGADAQKFLTTWDQLGMKAAGYVLFG